MPLKSTRFYIPEGVGGKCPLLPTGAHVPQEDIPWPLVALWSKTPGYATAVNSYFIFLRGSKCSLSPSTGAPVPHQKIPWSLVPLLSIYPGYVTEISTFFTFQKGVGQVPVAPIHHGRPCPTRKFLGPLYPASPKSWVRH